VRHRPARPSAIRAATRRTASATAQPREAGVHGVPQVVTAS
jgi:hypothetical protein